MSMNYRKASDSAKSWFSVSCGFYYLKARKQTHGFNANGQTIGRLTYKFHDD